MDIVRLVARRRIGDPQITVNAIAIARSRTGVGHQGFAPAIAVSPQRDFSQSTRAFDLEGDGPGVGRPQAESNAVRAQFRSHWHTVNVLRHPSCLPLQPIVDPSLKNMPQENDLWADASG
jgi:hypothetical protein